MSTPMNPLETFRHAATFAAIPPTGVSKAARSLTPEEARDVAVHHALGGHLTLDKAITFGSDGKLTSPKPGDKPRLGLSIGGVDFVPNSKAAASWTMTGPMDFRMAVLAVRLARFLREGRWGVSSIFWGGMGVGRDPDDRHGQGYALDFHGAYTRLGKLDVARDWGGQAVTLPNGKSARQWPATTVPYFRLDRDTNAGGFFYEVYSFLTGEAEDAGKPSSIGDRSFIVCPDSPSLALRASHQDHIHCEIDR